MKRPFIFILLLSFSVVVVSVLSSLLFYDDSDSSNNTPILNIKNKVINEVNYDTVDLDAPTISIYNVDENKIENMNMEEYLYGVLASEMPSTFNEEAL